MGLKTIAIIVVSLAISGLFIDTTDARRLESYRPPPPGPPKEGGSWVWVTGSKDDDDDWSGKSAFVLFYHVHMCVQCEVLVIWLLHLSLHCIHLLALATHMY